MDFPHPPDKFIRIAKLLESVCILLGKGECPPHRQTLRTDSGLEVVPWQLINIFDEGAFQGIADWKM
jgi:hypothetical protein